MRAQADTFHNLVFQFSHSLNEKTLLKFFTILFFSDSAPNHIECARAWILFNVGDGGADGGVAREVGGGGGGIAFSLSRTCLVRSTEY